MAVPQLQLANLGEIFAQNQAKQAAMDTMQLQQAEALAARDARIEKANREKLLREKLATGEVNLQSPEGFNQLLNMGVITPDQYLNANETLAAIAKNKAQGEAATRKAETAQQKLELDRQNIQSQIQNRNAQLQLSRAQEARMLREFNRGRDKTEIEIAQKLSQGMLAIPEEQRPAAYLALKDQFGGLVPSLFEDEGYSPEMGVVMQALANSAQSKAPSSTLGKLRADLQAGNITQEEFDAAQKKATTVSGEGSFNETQKLRKEYLDRSKEFIDIRNSYSALQAVSANPSAAGDISIVFSFMKMLDPISVVREGEQATVRNAAGIPDKIRNIYNKALTGEGLAPDQRQDILNQAKTLYDKALEQQERNSKTYINISEKSGLDPNLVVPDITLAQPTPTGGGQGGEIDDLLNRYAPQ